MQLFRIYKSNYESKIPKLTFKYAGYRGLKRGLILLWNGKLISLVRPINERQ